MILIIGLRDVTIGIDTFNYYNTYLECGRFGFTYLKDFSLTSEPGYPFLNILSNKLGLSWNFFCTICASMYIIPIFELIRKNSNDIFFSALLFEIAGFFFFPMSTMRQSIAMGICVLSYLSYQNNGFKYSILIALLASLFHVSAVIFLAFLLVQKIPLTKKNILIWFIAGVITVVALKPFLRSLLVMAMSSLSREYEEIQTGGNLQEFFFILTIVLPVLLTDSSFIEKHSPEIKAILFATILLPVLQFHPALGRLYFYFSIFTITFIPSFLYSIRDNVLKKIGIIAYIGVYFYLIDYYFEPERCLYPYRFFWN